MAKVFLCPADCGFVLDETGDPARVRARGNYRGCVGDGDVYGDPDPDSGGGQGVGIFQILPGQTIPYRSSFVQLSDGASNTIILSEGLIARGISPSDWSGPMGDIQLSSMGGSLFSTMDGPNSGGADRIYGPCPCDVGDSAYSGPCVSLGQAGAGANCNVDAVACARSNHARGVNVAYADGSVRFMMEGVSGTVWRGQGSRAGQEPGIDNPPSSASPGTALANTRILFIGNSYTMVNDLPSIIQQLFVATGAGTVTVGRDLVGGSTLEDHYGGAGPGMIASETWDYVVLQEQSMRPIIDRPLMWQFARLLDADIKKANAKTLFYMTWPRSFAPQTGSLLSSAYQGIARELGSSVAPAGLAWKTVGIMRPDINLYADDGSHPSPAGSFLTACVFYGVLIGQKLDTQANGVADKLGISASMPRSCSRSVRSWAVVGGRNCACSIRTQFRMSACCFAFARDDRLIPGPSSPRPLVRIGAVNRGRADP